MAKHLCVFCGRKCDSREHVWPDWLSDAFDDIAGFQQGYDSGPSWETKRLEHTVWAPCRKCNSGWMSRLETAVMPYLQPMIHGHQVPLTRDQCTTLSLWITKTCMMLDLAARSEPSYDAIDYVEIFERRQPISGAAVWIGARKSGEHLATFFRSIHPYDAPPPTPSAMPPPSRFEVHCLTIQIKHFVGQTIGHRGGRIGTIEHTGARDQTLRYVWPVPDAPITWPPDSAMKDAAALAVLAYMPMGINVRQMP